MELECGPGTTIVYMTDMAWLLLELILLQQEPKKVSSEEEVVVEKVKIYNEPKI